MVDNDMRAQVRNSFKDNHFTVLVFTAGTGEAVMCAIIIDPSKFKVTDVTGSNPLSEYCGDYDKEQMQKLEEEIANLKYEHTNGVDIMFTVSMTCTFNGVMVPTFVTCGKNGSITSELLTMQMLKRLTS
jgi:hypothetical protein